MKGVCLVCDASLKGEAYSFDLRVYLIEGRLSLVLRTDSTYLGISKISYKDTKQGFKRSYLIRSDYWVYFEIIKVVVYLICHKADLIEIRSNRDEIVSLKLLKGSHRGKRNTLWTRGKFIVLNSQGKRETKSEATWALYKGLYTTGRSHLSTGVIWTRSRYIGVRMTVSTVHWVRRSYIELKGTRQVRWWSAESWLLCIVVGNV